jgi:hypothetical protein
LVQHDGLVTVWEFNDGSLAELSRMKLESAGIEAWLTDEHVKSMYHGGAIRQRLQVRSSEAAVALTLLNTEATGEPEFPEELAPPPCPRCGANETRSFLVERTAEGFRLSDRENPWMLACGACQHEWPEE